MRLKSIYTRTFKHHDGGSFISLCNYESMIEMSPSMLENQLKESQSRAAPCLFVQAGVGA